MGAGLFLVSVVAGILGFTGLSAASAVIARFLFYVFVVIFLVLFDPRAHDLQGVGHFPSLPGAQATRSNPALCGFWIASLALAMTWLGFSPLPRSSPGRDRTPDGRRYRPSGVLS